MRSWPLKLSSIFPISRFKRISPTLQRQPLNVSISSDSSIPSIMTGQVFRLNSSNSRKQVISSLYTRWKNSHLSSMKPWQPSAIFSPTDILPSFERGLRNYSTRSYLRKNWWRNWSSARRNGCTYRIYLLLRISRSNWWSKLDISNRLISTWRISLRKLQLSHSLRDYWRIRIFLI